MKVYGLVPLPEAENPGFFIYLKTFREKIHEISDFGLGDLGINLHAYFPKFAPD